MTDEEYQELLKRAKASKNPLYGSVITLPQRIGWSEMLTPRELLIAASLNETVEKFVAIFGGAESAAAFLDGATLEGIYAKWDEAYK